MPITIPPTKLQPLPTQPKQTAAPKPAPPAPKPAPPNPVVVVAKNVAKKLPAPVQQELKKDYDFWSKEGVLGGLKKFWQAYTR